MNEQQNHKHPPRIALAIFRLFCRPENREDIEGDLMERFNRQKEAAGTVAAGWLFFKEVLLLFRPGIINPQLLNFTKMKRLHWIILLALNVLVVLMIISPFLPGPSNKFVIGISILGQAAGFLGLLLIPIGIAWMVVEFIQQMKANHTKLVRNLPIILAIGATFFIGAFFLIFQIGLFVNEQFSALVFSLPLGIFALVKVILEIRKLRVGSGRRFNPVPAFLVTVPLIATLAQSFLVPTFSNFSRENAIEKGQILVQSIESFREKEGRYPESINELQSFRPGSIPDPSIMGVLNFRYNKIGDHYSVSFTQWLELGSLEEIVMYDKNELRNIWRKGSGAGYDYKVDLCRVNGAFKAHDTKFKDWRYYWLD